MEFMTDMMHIDNHRVLDYGCGIGTFVEHLISNTDGQIYGYDVRPYFDDMPFWFRYEVYFRFHKVYFMHSIAHIDDLEQRLEELKEFLQPRAEIFVLTPNKIWLDYMTNDNYKPDNTVVKHRTQGELIQIFTDSGYKIIQSGQFGEYKEGQNERIYLKCTI